MYKPPDVLKSDDILWVNAYRIGDAIAAFTLFECVQQFRLKRGRKRARMYVREPEFLGALQKEVGLLNQFEFLQATPEPPEGVSLVVADDISLWDWNYIFHTKNIRLPVVDDAAHAQTQEVIFAPLLDCDYAEERAMSIPYVRDIIAALVSEFGSENVLIVRPYRPCAHTAIALQGICASAGVTLISGRRGEIIQRIRHARAFVGGDTGFSHIAGLYPWVAQIALHDRQNTIRHVRGVSDFRQFPRECILSFAQSIGIDADWCEYRSFPNWGTKRAVPAMFDLHGLKPTSGSDIRYNIHDIVTSDAEKG